MVRSHVATFGDRARVGHGRRFAGHGHGHEEGFLNCETDRPRYGWIGYPENLAGEPSICISLLPTLSPKSGPGETTSS